MQSGEGGFIPAAPDAVRALAAFAKQHGIVLIIDEIQTGFGRTGKMFACEHYDLVPDLIATAKSLAGGLPLAAVTGRAEIMNTVHPGGLGGTYGGNPLACAAALAVMDVMDRESLSLRAAVIGDAVRSRFHQLAARFAVIGDVRGLGAMMALELVKDRTTKEPFDQAGTLVYQKAFRKGLAWIPAGHILRMSPPIVMDEATLLKGLDLIDEAIGETAQELGYA